MKRKILIAIEEFAKNSDEYLKLIDKNNFDLIWNESGKRLDFKRDFNLFQDIDYIIAGLEEYPLEFFENNQNVKAISRVGVGVDNIDLMSAKKKGVKVFITTDKPSVAVSELCISNMIAILRSTFIMNQSLKNDEWNVIQGRDIRNCSVGIIGLGSIGKEVVKRLKSFGPKISGYARTWDSSFAHRYSIKRYLSLEEITAESDILTIHLPLEKETENLISENIIKRLKADSILINTSRAGVVDNIALANSLRKGHILGAAIDVFDEERKIAPYNELENVILTPHVGSHTAGTRIAMEESAINNILSFDALINPKNHNNLTELLMQVEKNSVV
tara:strand:+ start:513 stop:1508 length:996 start_codon:yes stop_codon:yes gene_type:complete